MEVAELKAQVNAAPSTFQEPLRRMVLYVTCGDAFHPDFADAASAANTYQELFGAIFDDESQKNTLLWAECAKLSRRNWLRFFQPKIAIENLRMKTDGLPVQMGEAVFLAPTGSRDNIANLYVFDNGAFNRQAAEFVTSLAGRFTVADHCFFGIYGLYKYRGNVILEEWEVEQEPQHVAQA